MFYNFIRFLIVFFITITDHVVIFFRRIIPPRFHLPYLRLHDTFLLPALQFPVRVCFAYVLIHSLASRSYNENTFLLYQRSFLGYHPYRTKVSLFVYLTVVFAIINTHVKPFYQPSGDLSTYLPLYFLL